MKIPIRVKGVPQSFIMFIVSALITLGLFTLIDLSLEASGIDTTPTTTTLTAALTALAVISAVRILFRIFIRGVIYESIRSGQIKSIIIAPGRLIKYVVAELIANVILLIVGAVAVAGALVAGSIVPATITNKLLAWGGMTSWGYVAPLLALTAYIVTWALVWFIYEKER
jgi:hypothetical protein